MSWEKRTLGDLCQIEKGKIGIQKATPGEFPLVVTAEERLTHNEFHFEGNAVVIPLVSSTGHGHRSLKRIHFQSGKFAVGNILCSVIPNDENILRADYLYRFLDLNREKELVGRMRGMANVTLPIKEIAQIEIPIPPIDVQIEFVQQYSNLERKSNELGGELTHQLDLVKQLRQSFLREAIQGKLVPQDSKDEPASVLLEKIKAEKERLVKEGKIKKQKPLPPIAEEEIPFEIPENWEWCRLGEFIELKSGQDLKPSQYSDTKEIGLPYITGASNLENEKVIINRWTDAPKSIAFDGDLLLTCKGSGLGKMAWLEIEKAHIARQIMAINTHQVSLKFLKALLDQKVEDYRSKAKSLIPGIDRDMVLHTLIPLPPLSEQQRIVTKLEELMAYCDELEASIKESQQQNELLLQQVLWEALEPEGKEDLYV